MLLAQQHVEQAINGGWEITLLPDMLSTNDEIIRKTRVEALQSLDPTLPVLCCCNARLPQMCLVTTAANSVYIRNHCFAGPLHAVWCPKYREPPASLGNEIAALVETLKRDATRPIRLHNGVFYDPRYEVIADGKVKSKKKAPIRRPRWTAPSTTSPLGFFARVMHESGVNVHVPGEDRSYSAIFGRITAAIDEHDLTDQPASRRVFVAGLSPDLFALETWLEGYREENGTHMKALAYGVLSKVEVQDHRVLVFLSGVAQPITIDEKAWKKGKAKAWYSRIASILDNFDQRDAEIVCALSVKKSDEGMVSNQISLMVTTRNWIQIHSDLERREIDRVSEMGRHFVKPIYRWKDDRYCHDLILLDTAYPFRVELNGWTSIKYLAYKEVVRMHLRETHPKGSWAMYAPGDPPIQYPNAMNMST